MHQQVRQKANLLGLLVLLSCLFLSGCFPSEANPPQPAPKPTHNQLPVFVDRTLQTGIDFRHFSGRTGKLQMPEIMGSGVGLLDYDQDGDLDLYLVQGASLTDRAIDEPPGSSSATLEDRLYRNDLTTLGDGQKQSRFVNVTLGSGLQATGYGMGVAIGDYDKDGLEDIFLANYGENQLWRNRGDKTFELVQDAAITLELG